MLERLATHLPELAAKAADLFGPAVLGWPAPTLHQAPTGPVIDCTSFPGEVRIYLGLVKDSTFDHGLYQLAHEAVHSIMLSGRHPTTMLEEGAAVWFSLFGPSFEHPDYRSVAIQYLMTNAGSVNYRDALQLHGQLNQHRADAVRHIRQSVPMLIDCKADDIIAAIPSVPQALAASLCDLREMR